MPRQLSAGQPNKRARISKDTSGSHPRRLRGRLSTLLTMPLDIAFEIFGHLPPADLIQLTRVSKAFRKILLTRRVSWLWKASYALDPNVPPCPEDMTLPAWAHLLFGGAFCHMCGAKPVNKVMFLFRRRVCKNCIRDNVCGIAAGSPLPLLDNEKKLAFCIPSFAGDVKPYGFGRFWWNTDVAALLKKLDGMRAKYDNTSCDAYEQDVAALETLMQAAYQTRVQHAKTCEEWEENRIEDRSLEIRHIKMQRFHDIIIRLRDMGYGYIDVEELRGHKEVAVAKPLTDRIWKRICPILEFALAEIVERRLHQEACRRGHRRRELVVSTYTEFLEGLPVRLAPLLATPAEILQYAPFADAIASDVPLDGPPWDDLHERLRGIMRLLGPLLLKNAAASATRLITCLPLDVRGNMHEFLLRTDAFHIGAVCGLGLATTHFILDEGPGPHGCDAHPKLMTGLDMLAHRCWQKDGAQAFPRYSYTAALVARELIELLGRGASTTAYAMDRDGARFRCGECDERQGRWVDGEFIAVSPARCWRGAVEHGVARHLDIVGQRPLRWTEVTQSMWQPQSDTSFKNWGCAHCHAHHRAPAMSNLSIGFISPWLYETQVIDHLRTAHAIETPKEGVDYIYDCRSSARPTANSWVM
ncbi:hypothetical protein FA95DRAFT_1526125 [Auriscalpium vulgare]|uniref:Uncharacterized protein n=1 Tax=Auriscalpium vulgare TaxID=40419 RepID=A0ACB8RCB4_9AGAM|nr:hypothetical protein FA95DRAFT_1526125 [Auriscalpium vulgare]